MAEETNMRPKPEQLKSIKTAWIFDVDGVITDPQEKKITEPEILDEVIKKLGHGEPIALNTGRSLSWMIEKVINPLKEKVRDKTILKNFFAVGEKGGTWVEFDDQGDLTENIDENISVPDDLKNETRNLIKDKYSESMFYDESKLTMITTEMITGHDIEDYRKKQQTLTLELKTLLAHKDFYENFKIDPTTIATDIENKFVGKHFAIKRIHNWLKKKGLNPERYITFGDSFKSDIPMAEEINSMGLPVEFVYVGNDNIDTSRYPFPIRQTKNKFGKGTLEYLKEQF